MPGLCILSTIIVFCSSFVLAQQQDEITAAEQQLLEASRKRSEAQAEFEKTQKEFANFFNQLQPEQLTKIQQAITQLTWQTIGELQELTAEDNILISTLRSSLYSKLTSTKLLPETLDRLLANKITNMLPLHNLPQSAEDLAPSIESIVQEYIPMGQSFEIFWEQLQRELPAANHYEKAISEYELALSRLEQLKRPDRHHPANRNVPKGMILIPGGKFQIGENIGWDLDSDRTKKKMTIKLKPYYMDRYEVTNREYKIFLDSLAAEIVRQYIPSHWILLQDGQYTIPPQKEEHPVTNIHWEAAQAYADWAGKRLPTEDEWEVAARGSDFSIYPWGDAFETWRTNFIGSGQEDTASVGSYPGDRSAYGIFDLAGNVMEWTASLPNGKTVRSLKENLNVITRGGSFRRNAKQSSCLFRWANPGKTTKSPEIGFRCAQDIIW